MSAKLEISKFLTTLWFWYTYYYICSPITVLAKCTFLVLDTLILRVYRFEIYRDIALSWYSANCEKTKNFLSLTPWELEFREIYYFKILYPLSNDISMGCVIDIIVLIICHVIHEFMFKSYNRIKIIM